MKRVTVSSVGRGGCCLVYLRWGGLPGFSVRQSIRDKLGKIAQLRCLAFRRPHRAGEAFPDLGKKIGAFT